jgi:methyltransferase (TIGR00027 family)
MNSSNEINHVSDTALWIAAYRMEETNRPDALFHDPYAQLLIGENGNKIATRTQGSRFTSWSVVIRTYIIDNFINSLVEKKIDTVINIGAGLDTRPYRLNLPKNLNWIEVDFENIIEHKTEILKNITPNCNLERISIDILNIEMREKFFNELALKSKSVLILTEGLIPYLSNEAAALLASSFIKYENFHYWITEYYSPEILEFLRTPKRIKQMKNSPFLFYPNNWKNFFVDLGWNELKTIYFGVESEKVGRTPPMPGWLKNDSTDVQKKEAIKYFLGYSLYQNKSLN